MKLYLVRHGQTEENLNGIFQGHQPGTLTALGVEQAKSLGLRLKTEKFDAIYSSDLKRAADTCHHIARFHRAPVHYTPLLRERCAGIFEAQLREALRQAEKLSGVPKIDFTPEGGESYREVRGRAARFLERLETVHTGEAILAIAHAAWNRQLLGIAMNKTIEESLAIPQENACVNVFEYSDGSKGTVHLLNCTEHLMTEN